MAYSDTDSIFIKKKNADVDDFQQLAVFLFFSKYFLTGSRIFINSSNSFNFSAVIATTLAGDPSAFTFNGKAINTNLSLPTASKFVRLSMIGISFFRRIL